MDAKVTPTASTVGAKESGLMKFGGDPLGFTASGMADSGTPGGNWARLILREKTEMWYNRNKTE